MRTLAQLARQALEVQDACNPYAVAYSYCRALGDLREALTANGQPDGTDALRMHPINRLWATAIHDLAGMDLVDMDQYYKAHEACKVLCDADQPV